MNKPNPRMFANFDDYQTACVDFAVSALPRVEHFDDYATAKAKASARADAADAAREDAFERWDDYIDRCVDAYDRGVGPAWEGMY